MYDVAISVIRFINSLPYIKVNAEVGFPNDNKGEAISVFQVPGSTTINTFMDEKREVQLRFQLFHKDKDQRHILETMTILQDELEMLLDLPSTDGSFEFAQSGVTNLANLEGIDETGNFLYSMDFYINVIVKRNDNLVGHYL